MDAQSPVRVYNEALGVKGAKGRLIQVKEGYYEVTLEVKERMYQALLPVSATVLLAAEPIAATQSMEVERF